MVRRPPRRRLRLTAWSGALLLTLAAGCAAAQPPTTPLAERLNSSLRQQDQAAFASNFTTGSAAGSEWFAALSKAAATFRQPDGQTLVVSATVPGDRRPATWTLRVELDGAGRLQGIAPTPDRPIWALGPVDVTTATHGTLLSTGLDASARSEWAGRLDRAAVAVARTAVAGEDGWPGGLVVEVPANGADFQAITNESPNTASALTACGTGTPRVVVNPVILGQPEEWLDSTLVHEAVHVATDSACVPAGRSLAWAVEGLAESVTARIYPATAEANRKLVRAYLRTHPVPLTLPADPGDLTSYALAQLAVDQVQSHLGEKADDLVGRATHESGSVTPVELATVTRWYVSALRRIAATR